MFGAARRLFVVLVFLTLAVSAVHSQAEAADRGAGPVFVVVVSGDIDTAKAVFVRRSLARAENEGASLVVVELSTFGGAVDAALRIATVIGSADFAPTVAYIPAGVEALGVSWSAGALIAFSCRRIAMAPGTSIGAAAPVYLSQEGSTAAPEKEVSAMRAQMAALAEKNGYAPGVGLAMVDKDVELVEVTVGGDISLVTADEIPQIERAATREGKSFERGRTVSPVGKLLTLTAGEMERYGLSSGTYAGRTELLERLAPGGPAPVVVEETVPDRIVAVITSPAVTALLLLVGIIALYLELSTPGFSVPGTVALICFATIFAGGGLLGTLGSLELILFIVGVALLFVELFVLPGFGVTGVSGILLIAASIVLSRQDFVVPRFSWDWDLLLANTGMVLLSLFVSFAVVVVLMRFLPRLPMLNRLILTSTQAAPLGFVAAVADAAPSLVGAHGSVKTTLRPVGKAEIGGRILEVEANSQFLEAGTPIVVSEVIGNRVVVERDPDSGQSGGGVGGGP